MNISPPTSTTKQKETQRLHGIDYLICKVQLRSFKRSSTSHNLNAVQSKEHVIYKQENVCYREHSFDF